MIDTIRIIDTIIIETNITQSPEWPLAIFLTVTVICVTIAVIILLRKI